MAKGGFRLNAGRPGSRFKVEACRQIDVRQMQRCGVFVGLWVGSWRWRDVITGRLTSSINVQATAETMLLSYCCKNTTIHEAVALAKVRCGFGGHRVLLHCPGCQERGYVLYLRNERFRCRSCHNLSYQSKSESIFGRLVLAQGKHEKRLLGNLGRPKGMHHATYQALRNKLEALKRRQSDLIDEQYLRER